MNVFVSSHQNLRYVSLGDFASIQHVPFSMRVLAHSVANRVNLLPTFSPLVRITLLSAHVYDFQFIAPISCVFLLVLDAVAFDGPLAGTLPFHNTSTLVRCEYNDVFAAAAEPCGPSVHTTDG